MQAVDFKSKYRLLRRLGMGGMAEVYLARQCGIQQFEKIVAIKTILPHWQGNTRIATMFINEARVAAQLNHSNIVEVYDFGVDEEMFYIVMEFVHGLSLGGLLKRQESMRLPLPLEIALYIMSSVCKGIDYAHRKNASDGTPLHIIHRDLDPQNILLSFEGDVKICDFGLARTRTQIHHSSSGVLKGKINYMAPEVIGGIDLDQRVDIFSLGITFYEMVTGKKPFEADDASTILQRIRGGEYEPIQEMNPGVPLPVVAVIEKAMATDRENRYQTAREIHDAVENLRLTYAPGADAHALARVLHHCFKELAERPILYVPAGSPDAVVSSYMSSPPTGIKYDPPKSSPPAVKTSTWAVAPTAMLKSILIGFGKGQTDPALQDVSGGWRRKVAMSVVAAAALAVIVLAVLPLSHFELASSSNKRPLAPAEKTPVAEAQAPSAIAPDTQFPLTENPTPAASVPTPPAIAAETQPPLIKNPTPAPLEDIKEKVPPAAVPVKAENILADPTIGKGFLSLGADVGCQVLVDGKPIGETPIASYEIAAGSHNIMFRNEKLGSVKTMPAMVQAGQTSKVTVKVTSTLMVSAVPWAEIYLDSVLLGETPLLKSGIAPGTHSIRLFNAKLGKDMTVTKIFEAGETVKFSKNFLE